MKLSKGQGISFFASTIIFGIFSLIIFLTPLEHTIIFWLGFFFALFAFIAITTVMVLYFDKSTKEDKFLNLPVVRVAWTYLILQMAISVWEMIGFTMPYLVALIINLTIGAVFSILILCLYATAQKIDNAEQYITEKVIYIKQLRIRLDTIETSEPELAKKIKRLSEDIRFSDQMSHSKLESIETSLSEVIDEIADNTENVDKALALCDQAAKLMKSRNEQCKMLKGVKDTKVTQKDNSGNNIALAGVGIVLTMFLITLVICFIAIPQGWYNKAIKHLEEEDYIAAEVVFLQLGDYRDSKEKIEEIHAIVLENQYQLAEELFANGDYASAMLIYYELNDYMDSKERIEEINNRLSSGNIIYFGTYNDEPIAWQIIEKEKNKLLLLADESIRELPVNSELESVEFKDSELQSWLNEDFICNFTDEQLEKILLTNGMKVFLFDQRTVEKLKENNIDLSTESDWWISTKSEKGFMYVNSKGELNTEGDLAIRDKGIRPAIWISLK